MQVVGLTGNIGSGKSTVAKAFAALGVPVFNSDEVAKKAYDIHEIQNEVRNILGSPKGPSEDNHLDFSKDTWKSEIAAIIFSNTEKRLRLESLIHAFVQNEFVLWKAIQHSKYVIRESALANSFQQENCDWLIEVIADKETRKNRVISRSETFPTNKTFTLLNNDNNQVLPEVLKIHDYLIG